MSREHHAGPVLGADRCPQRCLLPAIIQNPAPGNSERSEIFFDIGDQWQVRPVAHGIESDEVREQFADSFGSVVGHDLGHSTGVKLSLSQSYLGPLVVAPVLFSASLLAILGSRREINRLTIATGLGKSVSP